jgi:hypothetical protein
MSVREGTGNNTMHIMSYKCLCSCEVVETPQPKNSLLHMLGTKKHAIAGRCMRH